MRCKILYPFTIAVAACLLMVIASEQGHAQSPASHPHLFKKVQDTIWIFLPQGGTDTLDPDLVSGCYKFTMQYDSTCITEYLFTEPWHNGNALALEHWHLGRSVNINEDLLSLNSRTEDFTLHAGDTVSFMRDFRWFDARTQRQQLGNFFSRDTLTYVIELANAHDSTHYQTRAAVIDSFGVLPRETPGSPRFIGSGERATMGIRQFVVPTSLNGKQVFMRVRVRARGMGEHHFTRTDDYTVGISRLLNVPDVLASVNYMKSDQFWEPAGYYKNAAEMVTRAAKIMVIEQSISDPTFTIRLAAAPDLGDITVSLHDASGAMIGTIFSGLLDDPQEVSYSLPASGTYFINITNGSHTLHTEKIILTK